LHRKGRQEEKSTGQVKFEFERTHQSRGKYKRTNGELSIKSTFPSDLVLIFTVAKLPENKTDCRNYYHLLHFNQFKDPADVFYKGI